MFFFKPMLTNQTLHNLFDLFGYIVRNKNLQQLRALLTKILHVFVF